MNIVANQMFKSTNRKSCVSGGRFGGSGSPAPDSEE
jgi:hypothetical protein